VPSGRSKAQQWVDSSPSPTSSDVPPPSRASYRDAVLSQPQAKSELHFPRPAPRSEVGFCSQSQLNTDEQGWTLGCRRRRRSGRCRPHPLCPPHRQVPEDLRGRCFNCLSSSHRAAACRRPTRCFRCLEPGHRSYRCPRKLAASKPPRQLPPVRRLAWRPVPASAPAPTMSSADVSRDRGDPPGGGLIVGAGASRVPASVVLPLRPGRKS
jgi:hypothetical protein